MNSISEILKKQLNPQKIVLQNGLTIFVTEIPTFAMVHAVFGTNFGSNTRAFNMNGKQYKLPAGIAHFLEHKMFENEEGDAFSLYAKTGASANAYTGFDKTCYIFSATDNVQGSLDILLSFVTKPYFTKETVKKEQGIISQEIKMYDDNVEWRLMFSLLQCMYKNHPLKDDIAGTVSSIKEITPELLYQCCEAFYSPKNMVLSVAGNITKEQVLAACKRADIKASCSEVCTIDAVEPKGIVEKSMELSMPISLPIVGVGFKEKPNTEGAKGELIASIITEVISGVTTKLHRELYDEGLISGDFSGEHMSGKDYACYLFSCETKEPKTVVARLLSEIQRIKKEGASERLFNACKNMIYGEIIGDFDSVEEIAANMAYTHLKGREIFCDVDAIASVTIEDVNRTLQEILCEQRMSVVSVLPQ